MKTYAYGFPRLGRKREYKKNIEAYWNGKISQRELQDEADKLQNNIFSVYERYVDKFPAGEMTLYDNMLDTAVMLGLYEFRNLDDYYDLCRGKKALPMMKWFNTNYHYLVPEISPDQKFSLKWNKPREYSEKYDKGIPYLLGPFTFLKLSKSMRSKAGHLMELGEIYRELIKDFPEVHIDEPAFVMDLTREEIEAIKEVYKLIVCENTSVNLFTYYDSVDFLKDLYELPLHAIGLDFINGKENYKYIKKYGFPEDKILIAGMVNGRNIWRNDIQKSVDLLYDLSESAKNIMVSNAAPLYHLPVTVKGENLDKKLLKKLSFAEEKLYELRLISEKYSGKEIEEWFIPSEIGRNESARKRTKNLADKDFVKSTPYKERDEAQKNFFRLPLFPTTTIGSFPQTGELREKRANFRAGRISGEEYENFIREKIRDAVHMQEELGFDVLVHGEFERTDMVEFFAEKLDGMARSEKGWIISYGTRCYRPPIIYGDISRPAPMTLKEIAFAQNLTDKPVKGMLTGPVTIISWSYEREDMSLPETAYQIALCLQDEIRDYERAGIRIVQVDEPAFREKSPIKRRNWDSYYEWAIKSFNLSTISEPTTQINTHMCYSEFGEIIDKIVKMDFDVILIEATRSRGDIIESFENIKFDRQIGLGIWDIHSPVVPDMEHMKKIVERALKVIPKENFWLNPDCGLKTRKWEESLASLRNIIKLSREMRKLGGA